jgi:HSP20 family protein
MILVRRTYPTLTVLDDLFNDLFEFPLIETSSTKSPIYDIIENDNEYIIELQLAGVKKDDIDIDIDGDALTIKTERKEIKDTKYNYKETYFGKYKRSFVLPDSINKDNIGASLVDGILKIIIPKLENNKKLSSKKIEIK